ncbi:MAG: DUF1259 domain-containing protein [Candidatus Aminicenantales bacterium]
MRMRIGALLGTGLTAFLLSGAITQQAQIPADYQEVLTYLGRTGDFKSGVLKVNVPRNDLQIKVHGVALPTAFGFGGWVAMTKGDGGQDVMMGDLVLLQEEVNPVMSSLLDNGLEVTALHNHFFWDEPRLFYMHVHGMGKPADLARRVKPGLDLIGSKPGGRSAAAAPGSLNTPELARIVGRDGETMSAVFKITVGREDIDLREMGAVIGPRMGLNSWAAFFGSDASAVVAGDIAMLESEVTPVLKALRTHGLDVVAIHHHMAGVRPVVLFLHYWGEGPAAKLAAGFRAALDVSAEKPK